jgi:hypothetical protein
MATKRKKAAPRQRKGERPFWETRQNPVPRDNPKSGPPVYYDYEGGTIPIEKIDAAVRKVLGARGKLAKP